MAIEFECPECRATLRVGDDARGKKAQCPQCGKIAELPREVAPSPVRSAVPIVSMERSGQADNLDGSQITKGPLLPARIALGAVLSRGWNTASERYGLALAGSAIFFLLSVAGGMIANAISELGVLAGDPISTSVVASVSKILFDTWLTGGVTLYFLSLTRGQATSLGELLKGGKYLWRILGVNVVLSFLFLLILLFGCGVPALIGYLVTDDAVVAVGEDPVNMIAKEKSVDKKLADKQPPQNQESMENRVDHRLVENEESWEQDPRAEAAMTGAGLGLFVIFVPMIILGIMVSQAVLLVVDRGVSSLEAIRQSIRITRGNRMALFLLGLVSAGLVLVGVLACFVGLIFVMPFVWVIVTTAYLAMTGQISTE